MNTGAREVPQNDYIQRRKRFVNRHCMRYRRCIIQTAAEGHTTCTMRIGFQYGLRPVGQITDAPSAEEILEYLKDTFPNDTVSYEECERGILVTVDWS